MHEIKNHLHLIPKEKFYGNIIMLGFGSVNRGALPILFNHIENLTPERITIITADNRNLKTANEYGILHIVEEITENNYKELLDLYTNTGDLILNLTVDVDTCCLIEYCAAKGILYVDTCNEPWKGGYDEMPEGASLKDKLINRSNYFFRQRVLELRKKIDKQSCTAVTSHGMNPGIVSHFVKQALIDIAEIEKLEFTIPKTREEWANLSKTLGVKVVQISEHDTQVSSVPKEYNEVVCTWSPMGFMSEGSQAAEMGWGSHEKEKPKKSIFIEDKGVMLLNSAGLRTKVKTWTPNMGEAECFLITHNESLSLSEYFSTPDYKFTSYYAYRPCNDAIISAIETSGDNFDIQSHERLLCDEIIKGMDELGVLICYTFNKENKGYWLGSTLTIHEARTIQEQTIERFDFLHSIKDCWCGNSATSLQVVSGVICGAIWAIRNQNMGIIEAEDMDYKEALQIARPYLGNIIGVQTKWTPIENKKNFFDEDLDLKDPWQFKNFRIF